MCTCILQCLQELTNSCYQIVSPEFYFLLCTYKIIAFFAECCLRYFIKRAAAKLLYLSDRSMRRITNAVSWDFVQNVSLCLAIKSMFSTQSCVCNLGIYKYTDFFLNERWYKVWLKIAIKCFSNTRFTCKIISALYIWHQAGKVCFVATETWNRSSPSFLSVVTSPSSTKTSVA